MDGGNQSGAMPASPQMDLIEHHQDVRGSGHDTQMRVQKILLGPERDNVMFSEHTLDQFD